MERLDGKRYSWQESCGFSKGRVEAGLNIFISGGTSSGKTTFLNCLADYIPPDERLVVIEDSPSFRLKTTAI